MILHGDCLVKLKEIDEKSVNMCMTSPPYWALRDYGTASWDGGDKNCDHIANPKATKKFGNEEFNKNRPSREETKTAGYYENVCPKCGARRIDKQLGLEPTFEEYVNKLCDIFDQVKRVLRDDGTCWVNMGDTYSGTSSKGDYRDPKYKEGRNGQSISLNAKTSLPSKCLLMIPMRFAIEMANRGWILRNTIIWHKPNCMPSSASDRFTVDFEYIFFFSKNKNYYFETQREKRKYDFDKSIKYDSKGNPTYKAKVTKEDRDKIRNRGIKEGFKFDKAYNNPLGRIKRTVWKITTRSYPEAHFATYPEELCETPIKAGCPEGGIVLDPFFGAGTTGFVALKQNKKFIGIELNEEYIKIAEARLKPYIEQQPLFAPSDRPDQKCVLEQERETK